MSAIEYREQTLACDTPDCTATYGPFGVRRSLPVLRERAARDGWAYVPRDSAPRSSSWRLDEDYCPKDAEGNRKMKNSSSSSSETEGNHP